MEGSEVDWELLGFVLASENRRNVIMVLQKGYATPSQLSKACKIRIGHVSNILIDLKSRDLIECRNPEAKRGRIYTLTDEGRAVASSIMKVGGKT